MVKIMSNESLISFDKYCPLISTSDKSGFRLITEKVEFQDAFNFLCDNYGEGVLENGHYSGTNWTIREGYRHSSSYEHKKPKGFRLIAFEKKIIDDIFARFNINIPLDITNTIEYNINEAIKSLPFTKNTPKKIRKLQHNIAAKLSELGHNIQWYDISYDLASKEVKFNIKDTEFTIRL